MQNNIMPELPEVETIKEILKNHILNKTISNIEILREKTIVGDINEFKNKITNKTIVNMSRKGKFLIFHLDDETKFISHLRMEGKYFYYDNQKEHTPYEKVRFLFSDNTMLIYDDSRQFGIISLDLSPLDRLGKEPFDADPNEVFNKIHKLKSPIKPAIMDQNIMAGLGNIYADEVLFLSKIHPLTPCNLVTYDDISNIINNSIIVLKQAIKDGGSTIKSYHPQEGADGNFQTKLNAYNKGGKPCPNCGTIMKKIRVGGRGTTYCPHCQKNKALPYRLGITGPIGSGKSYVGKYLENKGFIRIDSDQIVHELYEDKSIQKEIIKLLKLKEFSVKNIRNAIICDAKSKAKLEKYIHPLVILKIEEKINSLTNKDKVLVEVPLLFEANMEYLFDDTIYIDVDEYRQVKNITIRNGDVNSSLSLNKTFKRNKEKATFIIENRSDLNSLNDTIDKLLIKLTL